MPKVTLISYTPDPEKTVAAAAKLCYSSSPIDEISKGLTEQKTASFLDMLLRLGHESPLEHVSFTFGIEGVSRTFLAQITRHRIASYSVKSQRYVNESMFEYVIPPEIKESNDTLEIFENAMLESKKNYDHLVEMLTKKHTEHFLKKGFDLKSAQKMSEKKAIEDARFVLPNACETKMVCTFNARSLKNFFSQRCCNRAQWEIREVATEMLKLVLDVAPTLFKNSGPSCLRGNCPEGKMSCGEINNVREFFKNLERETL